MNTVRVRCAESWLGEKVCVTPVELNQHQYCTWLWEIINNTMRNQSWGLPVSVSRLSTRMHLERPALQVTLWNVFIFYFLTLASLCWNPSKRASYGHYSQRAAKIQPDCICWIWLPASDSVLFFTDSLVHFVQNQPGSNLVLADCVGFWPNRSGPEQAGVQESNCPTLPSQSGSDMNRICHVYWDVTCDP